MPLFSSKSKLSVEDCCRQFYDKNIFQANIAGYDEWAGHLDTALKYIIEVEPLFSSVDRSVFWREMTALRMELFALAWFKKFNRARYFEKYSYPQSIFTKRYLEQNGNPEIWGIMGEYNNVVSQSATMNARGEKFSGGMGRAVITQSNLMRLNLMKDWLKNNPTVNLENEEGKNKASCIMAVINRLGADYKREDCVLIKLLSGKLTERLGFDSNLKPEAFYWLQTSIFGFNKGAEDYLKSIDIQE